MRAVKKQYLVLGLGRFGMSVAKSLCELGHEVLAVDTNEELVNDAAPYVTQAVTADATDEATLEGIGVRNFDVAIISIGSNVRDSILVSLLCKEMGIPYVVAKAVDDLHAKVLQKVGVDRVVFPEREMGQRVAKSLATPNILELMELANDHQLVETTMPQKWQGHTIAELDIRKKYGISILAIHRADEFIVSPGAQTLLKAGDSVLILGSKDDVAVIEQQA